jgi:hypothetical protein
MEVPRGKRGNMVGGAYVPGTRDFAFETRMRFNRGRSTFHLGRLEEGDQFSQLTLVLEDEGAWSLRREAGTAAGPVSRSELHKAPAGPAAWRDNQWAVLRVRVQGNRIALWASDVLLAELTDSAPPPATMRPASPTMRHIIDSVDEGGARQELDYVRIWRLPVTNSGGAATGASATAGLPSDFALEFDGRGDLVQVPSLKHAGNDPLTVECWVRPEALGRINTVFAISGRLFLQSCHLPGKPHPTWQWVADLPTPGTFQTVEGPPLSSVPRQLIHLAGVFDGKQLRLYIDGRRQTSPPIVVNSNGSTSPASAEFSIGPAVPGVGATIGGQQENASQRPFFLFDGHIDELRVSKVARYDADFTPAPRFEADAHTLALYHFDEGEGSPLVDASGNGHHGSISTPRWVPARRIGARAR